MRSNFQTILSKLRSILRTESHELLYVMLKIARFALLVYSMTVFEGAIFSREISGFILAILCNLWKLNFFILNKVKMTWQDLQIFNGGMSSDSSKSSFFRSQVTIMKGYLLKSIIQLILD